MAVTTFGKMLIDSSVPEDMRDASRVFTKPSAKAFFKDLAEKHPDDYAEVLWRLENISRLAATDYGRDASISFKDLRLPPRIKEYRDRLRERVQTIAQDTSIPRREKSERIVNILRKSSELVEKNLLEEASSRGNSFAQGVAAGYKASPQQLTQLLFGDVINADHRGRPIPIPGLHGYGEGVTPMEFWGGSYASRRGYSAVQFATAHTGFFGKQLALMSQRLKVTGNDCGARDVGIFVNGDDPENIGVVLAKPVGNIPVGHAIEKKDLPALKGKQILVRSLISCQQPEGICQKCAGKREQGAYPAIGASVGITSARVVAEPLVQKIGLSAKHTGGKVKEKDEEISGFEEITQFLQVPESFQGAAVLAPTDGRVLQVVNAPQGGLYVHVGTNQVYVPSERTLSIKKGDIVEAGDSITDGIPNPAELTSLKGLGEGRLYFIQKFSEILKKNNVPTHRRNIEPIARAFFDKVRITSPDTTEDYGIGDVVSYGDLQRDYRPRKDSENRNIDRSSGWYLEKPILHYTIGTRLTPKNTAFLKENGFANALVNKNPPGFEPLVVRMMSIPALDRDWKVRMSGFGLKSSFLDAARHGSVSEEESTAYAGELMDPVRL